MSSPATPTLTVDVLNNDFVSGWALGASGREVVVHVLVDGKRVGQTAPRLPRPDVAAAFPGVPTAVNSGFALRFPVGAFSGQGMAQVRVELEGAGIERRWLHFRMRRQQVHLGTVPRMAEEAPPHGAGPFPRQVLDALVRLDRDYATSSWTDSHSMKAARDIEVLARSGSKRLPGLYAYLAYLATVDQHARLVERHFPRFNEGRDLADKDACAVASSGLEMLAIAHHLWVLDSYGVRGCLVECGCFKGFSTSILSYACHQLGRTFHVFDSFAGLPPPSETSFYREGDFAGSFDEVTANVGAFGKPSIVRWHRGFFSKSVPAWPREPVALFWMDVDLETSARDALQIFPSMDFAGALFSHECSPMDFADGRPRPRPGPQDVVQPIVDAFLAAGRSPVGQFIFGNTGAFWDEGTGIPVLGREPLLAIAAVARNLAG
jgi:hypothetical protein